jgi:hypothetical protein
MVLKARDYGFIGLKLKDLIFYARGRRRAWGGVNIHWLKASCDRQCRLAGFRMKTERIAEGGRG